MKRIFSLLLAILLCALPLMGCKPAEEGGEEPVVEEKEKPVVINRVGDASLAGFTDFLDAENMVPGIDKRAFQEQMAAYGYPDHIDPATTKLHPGYACGLNLSFYSATNNYFRYEYNFNESSSTVGERYVSYGFCAFVDMIGLGTPYGISYTDGFGDLLRKIGVEDARCAEIIAALDAAELWEEQVLYDKDGKTLEAWRWSRDEGNTFCYALRYSESAPSVAEDGSAIIVTRTVSVGFEEQGGVYDLELFVKEAY